MCAPKVMEYVSKKLSRRDLFKVAAGSAVTATLTSQARAQTAGRTLSFNNLTDLTHTMSPRFPVFPGFEPMNITNLVTVEADGFYANRWDLGEHTGTHLDAPAHFITGATTADALPLERFIAPLAVVDISERAMSNPDATVQLADLERYEAEYGELPKNAAVMMYSGWETRLADPESFVNVDDAGTAHFPGFSPEAADFLINERTISGVGVDTLSLDPGDSQTFDTHVTVLGAGKWGLENVANLKALPPAGATLIVGSLKVEGASGGPVRLMAVWD